MGAPLRPCSGLRRGPRLRPAGPGSPLRGLRSGLGGMRPGPARLAPVRPSLRRPGLRRGPLSAARAARRGVRSAPCGGRRGLVPAPPAASGALPCSAWVLAAGPPLGGLAWRFPWPGAAPCSPHGGGVGPLAPPPCGRYCWPLLLSPEEDAERRRRPASRRAVSISAMAYSAVTVLLSWFSARRTLSMSPYFCSKSTA